MLTCLTALLWLFTGKAGKRRRGSAAPSQDLSDSSQAEAAAEKGRGKRSRHSMADAGADDASRPGNVPPLRASSEHRQGPAHAWLLLCAEAGKLRLPNCPWLRMFVLGFEEEGIYCAQCDCLSKSSISRNQFVAGR